MRGQFQYRYMYSIDYKWNNFIIRFIERRRVLNKIKKKTITNSRPVEPKHQPICPYRNSWDSYNVVHLFRSLDSGSICTGARVWVCCNVFEFVLYIRTLQVRYVYRFILTSTSSEEPNSHPTHTYTSCTYFFLLSAYIDLSVHRLSSNLSYRDVNAMRKQQQQTKIK